MNIVKIALILMFLTIGSSMPLRADDSARLRVIEEKQDKILAQLAEIKEQIEIVKVRSTR